jgi:ubiquinone/menaquinone biosynthesis C-methylase UbiE
LVDVQKRILNLELRRPARIGDAGFLVPERVDVVELLDQGAGTLEDVRVNLDEMWRLGALLGGLRGLTSHLLPMLRDEKQRKDLTFEESSEANHRAHREHRGTQRIISQNEFATSETVTVADLGTGGGRLPVYLAKWARRNGLKMRVLGLDLSARNLSVAQENVGDSPDIQLLRGDVLALPFAAGSVDVFTSSLFLHHFAPDTLTKVLRDAYRIARRGIVMNDITRGALPLAAFRLVQPVFARHELTRRDGITSIRRAYTPDELLQIAREAGLNHARVYRHFPWRMTLVAEKRDV